MFLNVINFLDVNYCKSLEPILHLIKSVIDLLKFLIPIGLILFGIIDLGKAVIASKEDEMKKAQGVLLKRFIYAVAVFFVFTLVNLVMNMVSDADDDADSKSWVSCWNKVYIVTDNNLLR